MIYTMKGETDRQREREYIYETIFQMLLLNLVEQVAFRLHLWQFRMLTMSLKTAMQQHHNCTAINIHNATHNEVHIIE